MISVISIGISSWCNNTNKINCAFTDSQKIYNAFEKVFQDDFCHYSSMCFNNLKSDQFQRLLENLSFCLSEKDILIIYFSGHGIIERGKLRLCFYDTNENGYGMVSVTLINEYLEKFKSKILIILDCCYSGAGLTMADNNYVNVDSKISVISSSHKTEISRYETEGSIFTNTLCETLLELSEKKESITVDSICKAIRKNGYLCYTNSQEGEPDVVLLEMDNYIIAEDSFVNSFIEKINHESLLTKEMLWYALSEQSAKMKITILRKYFQNDLCEASWLVRRAIGSLLCEMDANNKEVEKLVNKLINSANWMEVCTGLVAFKNKVKEPVCKNLEKLIVSMSLVMDAVWLANLYLTDSICNNLEVSLSSNLSKSDWGIIDIWTRYKKIIPTDELVKSIEEIITDKTLLKALYMELSLSNQIGYEDKCITLKGNELVRLLYLANNRGKSPGFHKKWMFSILNGSWRDQVNIDLSKYFKNYTFEQVKKELEEASEIPRIELRISIFQYFQFNKEFFEKYNEFIKWGLTDKHPWVRREAIKAFRNYPSEIEKSFLESIDRFIYPGVFDMLIEAEKCGFKTKQYIDKYNLTYNEKLAIKAYVNI